MYIKVANAIHGGVYTTWWGVPYVVDCTISSFDAVLDTACNNCHGNGCHVVLNFAAWHEDLVTWVASGTWLPIPNAWQCLQHAVGSMPASGTSNTAKQSNMHDSVIACSWQHASKWYFQHCKAVQHAQQCDEKLDL